MFLIYFYLLHLSAFLSCFEAYTHIHCSHIYIQVIEDCGVKIILFLAHKVVISTRAHHMFNNMASQILDLSFSDPPQPLELPTSMAPFCKLFCIATGQKLNIQSKTLSYNHTFYPFLSLQSWHNYLCIHSYHNSFNPTKYPLSIGNFLDSIFTLYNLNSPFAVAATLYNFQNFLTLFPSIYNKTWLFWNVFSLQSSLKCQEQNI